MLHKIITQTDGNLTAKSCQCVIDTVGKLPPCSSILDLNCGSGRSSVLLAHALDLHNNEGSLVLSVDSHIVNPLAERPFIEGTISNLLSVLCLFNALHRVVPVITPIHNIGRIVSKRSANLVVVQAPSKEVFVPAIQTAIYAIRKNGIIIISQPNSISRQLLKNFKLDLDLQDLHVYYNE